MEFFDLDTPLMMIPGKQSEDMAWTIRNAVEGVQIFGGIGSGKTSGSGRMLALKYLKAGFGGLVLTVKPDEKDLWQEYCKLSGREQDLIIVEPDGKHFYNFLDEENKGGSNMTENIVQILKTVIRASADKASGGSDDPFWETALDMLIFNVIDLCKLAYGKVSVQRMYDIVQTLPKIDNEVKDQNELNAFKEAFSIAKRKVSEQIEEWEQNQPRETRRKLANEEALYNEAVCRDIADARIWNFVDQFFRQSFMNLSEKTRSIIDFSFSGFLFRLMRDPIYTLFCSKSSTFSPSDCLEGKIILMNLPVKTYHKIGRDTQIMFKYIWQLAMEKRDTSKNERPVFLWADEAQNFLHEHDAEYQATARSSRIATVYLSQNIPNYHANMGGIKSDHRVKSFLGTLGTKIFHANADIETNRYASELIGDTFYEEISRSATASGQFSTTRSKSLKIDKFVRPEDFAKLKTGGPKNEFKTEAYMHLQGNPIRGEYNHVKILFDQNFK